VVLLAALVAVLLLIGRHPAQPTPPGDPGPGSAAEAPHGRPNIEPSLSGARPPVRSFITAFLAYEVGGHDAAAELAIRSHASPAFGRLLLTDPPTPPGRARPGSARITSLGIDRVPDHRDLVLASGDARRPQGTEPFSFLFERHAGRWLAVAPGE
jgi:hypothetical protein